MLLRASKFRGICLLKFLPGSRPQRCVSLAAGTRTPLPREVFAKGFDAGNAGAKLFTAENILLVEQAAEQALPCA